MDARFGRRSREHIGCHDRLSERATNSIYQLSLLRRPSGAMGSWTVYRPAGIATDSDEETNQQHCLGNDEHFADTYECFEHVDVACDNVCARPGG